MLRRRLIALIACVIALAGAAHAFDKGQYENVPADVRAWFTSLRSDHNVIFSHSIFGELH
jgi:hypothetical protein